MKIDLKNQTLTSKKYKVGVIDLTSTKIMPKTATNFNTPKSAMNMTQDV